MKISTSTEFVEKHIDDFAAIKMYKDAGFDALDYSQFFLKNQDDHILLTDCYKDYALKLKEYAASLGIHFNQSHAPFPTMKDGDDEYNEIMLPRVKRAIEVAGILGAENIIVHPVVFKENQKEKNIEMYLSLLETAKKAGVKIALENMFGATIPETGKKERNVCSTPEQFSEYFDALPKEHFSCCVDIGHCALVGIEPADFIRGMGDRVTCLHTHDNDKTDDWHFPPFTLDLNWNDITKALAEVGYNGYITLEADNILDDMPTELYPHMTKYLAAAAKKIADMVENNKKELNK